MRLFKSLAPFITSLFIFGGLVNSVHSLMNLGMKDGGENNQEQGVFSKERDKKLSNKTVKILNGGSGSKQPIQHMLPPPPPQNNGNNNGYYQNQNQFQNHYLNNNNQYPPQYPQSPQDLAGQSSGPQPSFQNPPPPPATRPETENNIPQVYVQIIGAIEKLVGRMDKLEAKVATLENIVLHLTNKKDTPQQGSCPEGFVKVDGIRNKCFHISTLVDDTKKDGQPTPMFDWKSAHSQCQKKGGRLAELISYDDFLRISKFMTKYVDSKHMSLQTSSDYWIGGINPGLIWIWTDSGSKVGMDRQFWNENDNSSSAPGCLKLSYSLRLNSFFFKGAPCSHSQNLICEIMDNSVSRALALFEKELDDE